MTMYIHYGDTRFRPKLYREIKNLEYRNKPSGGLWASAVDAEYGWKQWCEDNGFREIKDQVSFCFTLTDDANVYYINSIYDALRLPQAEQPDPFLERNYPDFERMKYECIDAIEYNLSKDWRLYDELYGWDCDCILILNPDVIKEIKP